VKKLVYLRLKYAFTNRVVSWKNLGKKLVIEFEKPLEKELEQEVISHLRAIFNPPKERKILV